MSGDGDDDRNRQGAVSRHRGDDIGCVLRLERVRAGLREPVADVGDGDALGQVRHPVEDQLRALRSLHGLLVLGGAVVRVDRDVGLDAEARHRRIASRAGARAITRSVDGGSGATARRGPAAGGRRCAARARARLRWRIGRRRRRLRRRTPARRHRVRIVEDRGISAVGDHRGCIEEELAVGLVAMDEAAAVALGAHVRIVSRGGEVRRARVHVAGELGKLERRAHRPCHREDSQLRVGRPALVVRVALSQRHLVHLQARLDQLVDALVGEADAGDALVVPAAPLGQIVPRLHRVPGVRDLLLAARRAVRVDPGQRERLAHRVDQVAHAGRDQVLDVLVHELEVALELRAEGPERLGH